MTGKKILVLIDQMEVGGAGRVTSLLLEGLAGRGHELVVAYDNVNCSRFYPIPAAARQVTLPVKAPGLPVLKQLRLVLRARRILRRERPDAVIAVTFFPYFYACLASLCTGVPVVAYDHTSFGRDLGRFVHFIRFRLYALAARVVILTRKDARLLGKRLPRKVVVYNPLTYRVAPGESTRGRSVLCAGRLDSWDVKGFDRMIDIWGRLAPRHPGWRLRIAGDGRPEKLRELRLMARRAGVEDRVDFLGQVTDMPALYAATPLFALPSRVEGFPMVLLEAMSQGCVCCSFEMGGAVGEMMGPGSGEIVADGDLRAFEESLGRLMDRFPRYEALRESAWRDAGRFTREEFYDQWERVLDEVTQKGK